MSIVKKRLSPEESRLTALEAARALLVEAGPQAVTLKAVAGRIDRTHANLLHHFGSAAGLQKELSRYLCEDVCRQVAVAVAKTRALEGTPRDVVDLTFDAFDKQGAGALASWMILSGNEDALDPLVEAIHKLVDDVGKDGHDDRALHDDTLALVLMAMGDALLGAPLANALGLPRTRARDIAEQMMIASLDAVGQPHK